MLFGIGSVIWWRATGDLRVYAVAQFAVGAWYVAAKLAETFDRQVYAVFPLSGHTLKHLAAAVATYYIFRWRVTLPARPISR